jgi:hypothetical protein
VRSILEKGLHIATEILGIDGAAQLVLVLVDHLLFVLRPFQLLLHTKETKRLLR